MTKDRNIQINDRDGKTVLATLPELLALRTFGLVGFSRGRFFVYVSVNERISIPRFLRERRRKVVKP